VTGLYTAGWIKRGPSGVIGTNKPDAVETVDLLLADFREDRLLPPGEPDASAIPALLRARGVHAVIYPDWHRLDAPEQGEGKRVGRPRIKFTRVDDMLAALKHSGSEGQP
jgi:ferredoxin--NADP+ reductase